MDKKRICPVCGDTIFGRIDKKFCSDQCRTEFNNRNSKEYNNYIRKINSILKKNRRILVELNPNGKTKILRTKLIDSGFNFDYHTHVYKSRTGNTYYFCYEHGYIELEDDYCAIVKKDI
ncbi:MAG: DUF2116 family Zn-ribbon domain-containing protein [Bacteroidales bacterium]|nr:DUF2116 family Zn-ribbon domain-containing protein [Bacteroidales bacterium]